ncbi:hypothetical protein LWI29_020113 [Acer saccharum]|uniref:BED-type domain-containing protein n=1 Tax=Acer saccharum TaxID=4024 RepID=A0AA39RW17_ACESA|nr:hypothetical protein LWI29_020113 [Acer saccharum]
MVGLDLDKSSNKKQKKLRSDVWNHFEKYKGENGKDVAKCNNCKKPFNGSSEAGTTHLRNHFKSCSRSNSKEGGGSASGDKPAENSNQTQEISQIGEQNVVKETVSLDLGKSSNKKQNKLRSDVWDNFEKRTDENGKEWAMCNICKVKKDGSSKKGTTHLRNHFNSCSKNKKNEGGGSASGDKPAENDDMQHLFIFNMGGRGQGQSSSNATEDVYPYSPPFMPNPSPNYSFDDEPSRSSGKAVVGWPKIKAAVRLCIFIRKKAAERRAQVADLLSWGIFNGSASGDKPAENDDMQHLFIFNMGGRGQGQGSSNATEVGCPYSPPFMSNPSTNYSFDDKPSRSSGKAVVGWPKIKAAVRLCIFIRKKAAERRAQVHDLLSWSIFRRELQPFSTRGKNKGRRGKLKAWDDLWRELGLFQTTAPKSCFMRPPGAILAPGESLIATVFKFVELPENNEKPLDQNSRDKFKIISMKVQGPMDYVPELFDEQKDQVPSEQILQVVFLDPGRSDPALEKLKRYLTEADAAVVARKKPPEEAGPRIIGEGLVIDEWEISQIGEQNIVKETVGLDLGKSSNKKQKKLRSDVWDNFEKHTDENGKEWAICNICKVKKDGSSKQGTTHLRNHFNSCSKNKSNEGGGSASGDKPAENSVIGGYNDSMPSRFPMQPQNINVNAPTLLVSASQQVHLPRSNLLALGPSQSSSLGFQSLGTSNPNTYRGVEDFFSSEDEICMRSHEMLENEAKTDALTVKDHRGELYKKHYPPVMNDEVWRLEKIGKDGSFHKRLNRAGIYRVEDFLRFAVRDSQKLRNVHVDTLVKKAYDNWMQVIEYDGKSPLYFMQNKSVVSPQEDIPTGPQNYLNSFEQQITLPTLTVPAPPEQPSMDSSLSVGDVELHVHRFIADYSDVFCLFVYLGYNDSMPSRFQMHPKNVNVNAPIQLDGTSYPLQTPLVSAPQQVHLPRNDNLLAPGPSQSSSLGFQNLGTSNPKTYSEVYDLFSSADEIRMRSMRSHEMLENDDMQHLLPIFNTEGQGQGQDFFNATEDAYPCSSANYSFDDEPSCSLGITIVGRRLKVRAALRPSIGAKAAVRRAQLLSWISHSYGL